MSAGAAATTTAALAGLIAVAAFAPGAVLALAVLLVACLVAVGWPGLLDLPARRSSTAVVVLTALAAVVVSVVVVGRAAQDGTLSGPLAAHAPAVAALGVLAAFGHQLLRRDGRPRLVESVTSVVLAQAVVVLAAAWTAVPVGYGGPPVAAVALAGVVTATAATAATARWSWRVTTPSCVVAGAAGGWVAAALVVLLGGGGIVGELRWTVGGLVAGLAAGVLVPCWHALVARLPAAGTLAPALAVAAAPVAAAGGGAYLLGRLFLH